MMASAAHVRLHELRRVTIIVADAEPTPADYSRIGRSIIPDRMELEWVRRDAEPWQLIGAELSGPIVLSSGQPSDSQRMTRRLIGYGRTAVWRDDAPEWARNMAIAYAPAEVTA